MKTITENSKVTLGVVAILSSVIFFAAIVWAKVERLDSFEKLVQSIDSRLSRIEGALGVKEGE